jgi:hypothetical protein
MAFLPGYCLTATVVLRHCYGIAPMGVDPPGSSTVAVPEYYRGTTVAVRQGVGAEAGRQRALFLARL